MKFSTLSAGLISFLFCSILSAAPQEAVPSSSSAIVIGFVGGLVGHTNEVHSEVRLATQLRKDYRAGVYIRVFENRRKEQALHDILRLLDVDQDGELSSAEKRGAQIIIYGHSWGASETVALARALGEQEIPVLLTIQVDSVRKPGEDDGSIPVNVAQAVNFYQRNGWVHGRSRIHADDSSRTRILGNIRFDYTDHPVSCAGYPWYALIFMKPHIEIESDPKVWRRVESLIRSELPPVVR